MRCTHRYHDKIAHTYHRCRLFMDTHKVHVWEDKSRSILWTDAEVLFVG